MQVIHQLMSKRTEKNKEMGKYKLNNCEQRAKDLAWYRNILCEVFNLYSSSSRLDKSTT